MLDQKRVVGRPEDEREKLFMQRYDRLLAWALQLTSDRSIAEDLVQDAFIQFTRGRTSIDAIANIDGYLRRMLRYMNLARLSRNTNKIIDSEISLADYDSFNLARQSLDISRRMQAHEQLQQICRYSCLRKQTSRAGSVLILRFFHEYFPSEIAQLVCRSRHCVDEWQHTARVELKAYLTNPKLLKFVGPNHINKTRPVEACPSDANLLAGLRQMIFASREGECLSMSELNDIYCCGATEKLTTVKFAHVVSCYGCLDAANSILGLPTLRDRFEPTDHHDTAPPADMGGGNGSGGYSIELKRKLDNRMSEVIEHQPKELRVMVDGAQVSVLKVNSENCEFDLRLSNDDIHFIEVLSEQSTSLLFFGDIQRGSNEPQWAQIELSDGRTLEARIQTNTLSISYSIANLERITTQQPLKLVPNSYAEVASGNRKTLQSERRTSLNQYLSAIKESIFSNRHRAIPNNDGISILTGKSNVFDKPFWVRPSFVAIVVLMMLVTAFVLFRFNARPSFTASTLLKEVLAVEQTQRSLPGFVIHRVLSVEERDVITGGLVSRRKVETWEDAINGKRTDRIYDENEQLIAARWQIKNQAPIIYHHPSAQHGLIDSEQLWQFGVTGKDFTELVGTVEPLKLQAESSYLVTTALDESIGGLELVKASLSIDRNLRPTEETLIIKRGAESHEYRFVVITSEQVLSKDVEPTLFDPVSAANSSSVGRERQSSTAALISSPALIAKRPASAELEVEVASLLNSATGDRAEQLTLTRDSDGLLRVEGIVESKERKNQLIAALSSVHENPSVRINISASSELQPQPSSDSANITARETDATAETIAVDDELRKYLSGSSRNPNELDAGVRQFSAQTVNGAYRALFHAIQLEQIVNRFNNVDMHSVTPDARAKWLAMMRGHAAAIERELGNLSEGLQPIFLFADSLSRTAPEQDIDKDEELSRDVRRLHKLTNGVVNAIRSAFTISAKSSSVAIKSPQFWKSLIDAQTLASRIKKYVEE
ncbi:MAG: RNA polymerase sigma factor [Pyrinomonadaceae bacterium]